MDHRSTLAFTIRVVVFAVVLIPGAGAQETRWNELNAQVNQLYAQGKYAEAIPVGQEALRVAEATFGSESWNVASSCARLGGLYGSLSKFNDAEPLLKRALKIDETAFGPQDPTVARDLTELGEIYSGQAKYSQAEPLFQRVLSMEEKGLGPDDPKVAEGLLNLAENYKAEGKYSAAEPLLRRALAIEQKAHGPDHADVSVFLNNLGGVLYQLGKYSEAEPLMRRALVIDEKALGAEHPLVALRLSNLSELYLQEGKYTEAEPLARRALAIDEKALSPNNPDVAIRLHNLAALLQTQGKYKEARPLYQRALAIDENAFGPEHPDVAVRLNNLAELDSEEGLLAEAEKLYRRSLEIRERVLGAEHPDVAEGLNNLVTLYEEEGRYAEAERLAGRSLAIAEKALGPEHIDVSYDLANVAGIFVDEGRYADAEPLYRRALAIREKVLGPDHPNVAQILNNLAGLYRDEKKDGVAESLARRALSIDEKSLGPNHPEVANSLAVLAGVLKDQGRYTDAEPLFERALAIREKAFGLEHLDVAGALNNLAELYRIEGRYAEAEPLFKRSVATEEKMLGSDHPNLGTGFANLAVLYYAQGKSSLAGAYFNRSLSNAFRQFQYRFTYLNEKERLSYLQAVHLIFSGYFSFCVTYNRQDSSLAGSMYDVVLWEKGFIASSIAALRTQIASSGDKELLALLVQLSAEKTHLAALLTSRAKDRDEWKKDVEEVQRETDELEKQLVQRSSAMAEKQKLARSTWRDVQKALEPGEAAVEFVRFQFHEGKKWTKKLFYVALIVTPTSKSPALVSLGEAGSLESGPIRDYRKCVGLETRTELACGPGFYDAFWKPLEMALGKATRIYLSPDGVLNQVSLGAASAGGDHLMLEQYDLRILSSTRDILRENSPRRANTAVLLGNPTFNLSAHDEEVALQNVHSQDAPEVLVAANFSSESIVRGIVSGEECPGRVLGGVLCPLPGTQLEVDAVDDLLQKQGWQAERPFVRERALKQVLLSVNHPRVLHIATHGFFEPDPKVAAGDQASRSSASPADPMLRSGLLFAGADRVLRGESTPEGLDNGVLTAYEASSLDLHGTELVVLSACKTGLGQVQSGEGVFGLRRAFEEAGAESVLMTMWSVPDRETEELMTLFYKNWLSGMTKPDALRNAEKTERDQVKKRYGKDLPYYWGAFVLVGR